MRTFVQIRSVLLSNRELEKKILAMEAKYDGQFKIVFDAIRKLVAESERPRKRIAGLGSSEN